MAEVNPEHLMILWNCNRRKLMKRFFKYVLALPSDPKGCWLWTGGHITNNGYGKMMCKGVRIRVHRIAYFLANDTLPEKNDLHHKCENTLCVNPLHLEEKTRLDHVHESNNPAGINYRKAMCPNGHEYNRVGVKGDRLCRVCLTEKQRLRRASIRAAGLKPNYGNEARKRRLGR